MYDIRVNAFRVELKNKHYKERAFGDDLERLSRPEKSPSGRLIVGSRGFEEKFVYGGGKRLVQSTYKCEEWLDMSDESTTKVFMQFENDVYGSNSIFFVILLKHFHSQRKNIKELCTENFVRRKTVDDIENCASSTVNVVVF